MTSNNITYYFFFVRFLKNISESNKTKALSAVVISLVLIQPIRRESVNKEKWRGERNGSDTPAH